MNSNHLGLRAKAVLLGAKLITEGILTMADSFSQKEPNQNRFALCNKCKSGTIKVLFQDNTFYKIDSKGLFVSSSVVKTSAQKVFCENIACRAIDSETGWKWNNESGKLEEV